MSSLTGIFKVLTFCVEAAQAHAEKPLPGPIPHQLPGVWRACADSVSRVGVHGQRKLRVRLGRGLDAQAKANVRDVVPRNSKRRGCR